MSASTLIAQYFEIREVGKTIKRYFYITVTSFSAQRNNTCGDSNWKTKTTL